MTDPRFARQWCCALAVPVALATTVPAQVQTIPALSANQEIAGGFGAAVAGTIDLDKDGRGDFIVGAPAETSGGLNQGGRVYVYSGRIGLRLYSIESPRNESYGNFGWAVSGVPDANGDGDGDFIVGAPNENPAPLPTDTGRAYLYSGADGSLIRILGSATPQAGGRFGYSVAGMGDITLDGRAEMLVGAPFETDGTSPAGAGRVYQYNGATGARIRTLVAPVEQANARFGWAVAALPDINGDGRDDIAIGAPFYDEALPVVDAGRVYIFNGRTGAPLRVLSSTAAEDGGRFGYAVAGAPDLNGDNRGDVIVGAPYEDPGLTPVNNGRAYTFSGASGLLLRKLAPAAPTTNGLFGLSVGATRDLNGDNRGDVMVGARGEATGFIAAAGRAHLFSGATGVRISAVSSPAAESGGGLGAAVAGVPDANLNGRGDFVVGAPDENPGSSPTGAGRVYLFKW